MIFKNLVVRNEPVLVGLVIWSKKQNVLSVSAVQCSEALQQESFKESIKYALQHLLLAWVFHFCGRKLDQ